MKEYIDKEKLLTEIQTYKNKNCWNTKELDEETIMRVLSAVENIIKHQEKAKTTALQKAKKIAMEIQIKMLEEFIADDERNYKFYLDTNHEVIAGFYKGQMQARIEAVEFLKRMV